MKTAEKLLSLDEYLDRDFEPNTELIAGELRPKPLTTFSHSFICGRLLRLLALQTGDSRSLPELSLRIGDDVLIPDVGVLRQKPKQLYRGIVAESPLLCAEVLSQSQSPSEMLAKCERYHKFGVPFCWVIDPETGRAWEYHSGSAQREQPTTLMAGELSISLAELFSEE